MSYRRLNRPHARDLAVLVQEHATLRTAADSLGVSQRTLRRWLAAGEIRVGRALQVSAPAPRLPWWRRLLGLLP